MLETIQTTSTWITWTILHFIWMGFAVWVLAQGYRLLFPSTRAKRLYRANLVGLLALIACLPVAAIFGAWSWEADIREQHQSANHPIAAAVNTDQVSQNKKPNLSAMDSDSNVAASNTNATNKTNNDDTFMADSPALTGSLVSSPEAPQSSSQFGSLSESVSKLSPLIAICYLIGMTLMMCRLMAMVVGCRRIKNKAITNQDADFFNRLTRIANQLGVRAPAFRLTTRVSSPMVVGLLKPILLVPATLISGMTTAELDAVLIHELAHLKRYDHFVVIFQRVAEAIFFFHPVVWFFSRGISQTRELCCDDVVLEQGIQPLDYAKGLCHVAEFSQNKKAPFAVPALAATGESSSELLGRVRRVLGDSANVKIGQSRFAALTIAIMILAPAMAISAFALVPPVDYELINSLRSAPPQEQVQIRKLGFVVKGRVVDEAGNPVANATLRGTQALSVRVDAVANENGEFEIEFAYNFDAMIIASSPDKQTIGTVKTDRESSVKTASKPLELKLRPAVAHVITVTKDGQSVSDALVSSRTIGYPFLIAEEKTNGKGVATLLYPAGTKIASTMCWHESLGVCAITTPTESQEKEASFEMKLLPTRTCKAIVLDENEQPVPNISVSALLKSRGDNPDITGVLPASDEKTDANGEVEFKWLPPVKDYDFKPGIFGNQGYSWNQLRSMKSNSPSNKLVRVYVDRTPIKTKVKGKLVGGKGDLKNIRVSGRGYRDDTSDYFESFTNSKGEFEIDLVPGMQYSVGITNDLWASDVSLVQAFENKFVSLDIYPATPITVTLTSGKNKTPVTEGGVQFTFKTRLSGRSPTQVVGNKKFNEKGQLIFGAPNGYIDLRIIAEGWNLKRKIRVQQGKPQNLVIHAPAIGMRMITGKVTGPKGVEVENCDVQIEDQYQHRDWAPVKTKSDGTWSAEVDSQQVAVSAFTADKKYGGIAFKKELGETMKTIKLRPTVTVSGILLDEAGKPIKEAEVCQMHKTNPMFGEANRLPYLFTRTDKEGAFEFKGVITGIPQKLCLVKTRGSYSFIGNSKVFKPGEDINGIRATYVDYARRERELRSAKPKSTAIAPSKRVTLPEHLRVMAAKCQAESMHGLVIIAPQDAEIKKQLESLIEIPHVEPGEDENPFEIPIVHFLPQALTASPDTTKESLDHLAKLKIEIPKDKQLVCFVVNGAGEKIDNQTFDTRREDLKAAFEKFLIKNLPAKRDARKLYESALAKAAKEGKNVFVKIGGPRCSPCLKMGAWLHEQHSIFEKDYVMFSFHPSRCEGGKKLATELCNNYGGVPWYTIRDKDGKEIINSEGPLGNIGFPTGKDESIEHFITMLKESRKNLTDEDLAILRKSLEMQK